MSDAPDNRDAAAVPSDLAEGSAATPRTPALSAGAGTAKRWSALRGWLRELVVMAAIAAVVLVTVGWLQRERQRGGGGELPVASDAPSFAVQHLDGRPLASSELRGKPTVLVFWATWCGVCQAEMPDLERFAAAAQGRYNVLAVSRERPAVLRRWAADHPQSVPLAHDPGGQASAAYKIESLPTHVIIDAQGRVVHDFSGAADPEILAEHMRRLL